MPPTTQPGAYMGPLHSSDLQQARHFPMLTPVLCQNTAHEESQRDYLQWQRELRASSHGATDLFMNSNPALAVGVRDTAQKQQVEREHNVGVVTHTTQTATRVPCADALL